ncbi:MAG: efflux RND transporter periplasmic adaptor subunit [Halieaceae bacterium]|jgi:RND family efflux transporter MFP subunit|nr:efflux RND transporter periplasmic adaptor subunit [Halieaceae bacterium]
MNTTFAALVAAVTLVSLAEPAAAQSPVPVSATEVTRREIFRSVPMTGTVTSERSARLSAATEGLVHVMNVDAGFQVRRGDVLMELDPELTELQLQAAEARVKQARSELSDARRRLEEAEVLVPKASIAESTVRDREAEVVLDEAALQQAVAEAGFQRAVLARHQVRAPFDGVVSAKLTELGEWVTPGQPVFELVALDAIRLDFSVSEDFLPAIAPGGRVGFSLSARPGETFAGEVTTVVPVTDRNARTFLLRVRPSDESPLLLPGMSVTATLKLPTGRDGLVVPRDALLRYPDGRTVVWTVGDNVVSEHRVQTGLQFDGMVEIRGGIEPGDKVVVEGNEALRDGQSVELRAPVAVTTRGG